MITSALHRGTPGAESTGPATCALDTTALSSGPARRASPRGELGHTRCWLRRYDAPGGYREPAAAGLRIPAGERPQPAGHPTAGGAGRDCGPTRAAGLTAGSGIRVRRAALRYPAGRDGVSGIRLQQRQHHSPACCYRAAGLQGSHGHAIRGRQPPAHALHAESAGRLHMLLPARLPRPACTNPDTAQRNSSRRRRSIPAGTCISSAAAADRRHARARASPQIGRRIIQRWRTAIRRQSWPGTGRVKAQSGPHQQARELPQDGGVPRAQADTEATDKLIGFLRWQRLRALRSIHLGSWPRRDAGH
jgi:hypothetical protein